MYQDHSCSATSSREAWRCLAERPLCQVGGRVVQVASNQVFSAFSKPVVSLGVRSSSVEEKTTTSGP